MGDRRVTVDEARATGKHLGLDWGTIDPEQFRRGLEVELEHGAHDPETDVTHDDPVLPGKIAWAHLKEIRDYYTRLDRLEAEAKTAILQANPAVASLRAAISFQPSAFSLERHLVEC